jgi:hypothetical protein
VLGIASGDPAGASPKVTTVKAIETEFHIALSVKHFKPDRYVFLTENKGGATHALEITGPTTLLGPGQPAKLKVTLKKGKYDVFGPSLGTKTKA